MYHKVKIKKLPNKAVGGGINGNRIVNNQLLNWGGADFNMAPQKPKVTGTITGVPRDKANLEAEGGETVYGDINGDGMAEHLTIKGPRHSSGGVPLNLPDGTFIFSDTKSMKIKDPAILALFNKSKGSYTPADLAKTANISKYRKILQDPDSDDIDRKTAELMIRNYNMKLGALALAQESKKGFPQGIPEVSRPYMMAHNIDEQQLIPQQPQQQMPQQQMGMPQEEMMEAPMAQYGYEMPFYSGDAMPMYDEYAYGGSLDRYQDKGEVKQTPKSKAYTKDQLPAGARTRDKITTDTRPGDFVLQPDGTYLKVSKAQAEYIKSDTKSSKMSASEWAKSSPENKQKMDRANQLIEEGLKNGTIVKTGNGIKITGDFKPSLADRVILQEAFSNSGGLATDKYTVKSQGATGPYSGFDKTKNKLSPGSFVGGWTPEDHEQMYIYNKAKGQGMSHQDALNEVDRIQKDPEAHTYLRKEYANSLGVDTKNVSDEDIMKPDYFKKNYADITMGTEAGNMGLSKEEYRTKYGDDALFGWEHADARGVSSKYDYEAEDVPEDQGCPCGKTKNLDGSCPPCDQPDEVGGEDEGQTPPPPQSNPQWWLQDKLKVAGALADRASIKRYMPWAPKADLESPTPTYLDPTRELAAQSEQANIATQMLGQFAGSPQAASARLSSVQGSGAKQAADTLSKYNNANVNLANQFGWKQSDVNNQEQLMNQATTQRLYDQTTVANQQFDNAKRAARNNVLNQYISGITNANKTDALNQMYPNFRVDAPSGGRAYFNSTNKTITPSQQKSLEETVLRLKQKGLNDETAYKVATQGSGDQTAGNDAEAYQQQYGFQKKGGTNFAYVMGSNVFPPFFY